MNFSGACGVCERSKGSTQKPRVEREGLGPMFSQVMYSEWFSTSLKSDFLLEPRKTTEQHNTTGL